MKIKKVNLVNGQALFVMEELPETTFCINLKGKTTAKEITDELKSRLPKPDAAEQTFNDLKLKELEGTEI